MQLARDHPFPSEQLTQIYTINISMSLTRARKKKKKKESLQIMLPLKGNENLLHCLNSKGQEEKQTNEKSM